MGKGNGADKAISPEDATRIEIMTGLEKDPNVVVIGFAGRSPFSDKAPDYFDPKFESYKEKLGSYISKQEFESCLAQINKRCGETYVSGREYACYLLLSPCTLCTSLFYVTNKMGQWIPAVESQLSDEINPTIKDKNVAFELRKEAYGPYLLVRILSGPQPSGTSAAAAAPPAQSMSVGRK